MRAGLRLVSTLTCPVCGAREALSMPEDACLVRHACASCGAEMRPKPGDCCVFCSFGDVPCPPKQKGDERCAPPASQPCA